MMNKFDTEIVVLGAGPGGYAAAFYAADQGKKVILVEQEKRLGGVCLNRGCIPSKALLTATGMFEQAELSNQRGIKFSKPSVEVAKLRAWKESILEKLSAGIKQLADRRGVQVLSGRGFFEDSTTLRVETSEGQKFVKYQKAIVATGSRPALPALFDLGSQRIMTSTEALEIEEIPQDLLIVGGGYIGMELGTVYARLGSKIVVVEALDSILAGADTDLVRPIKLYAEKHFKEVRLKSKVTKVVTHNHKIKASIETDGKVSEELFDRVLVSVGRVHNNEDIGLENTKVTRDGKGFILVSDSQVSEDPSIYAIGDAVGGVMLAHKAAKEARIAVDAILGEPSTSKHVVIPAVVFTDPEVAWCGITEAEARAKNLQVQVVKFPWSASGRAMTYDRTDGITKLIVEPVTERILGVGICGHGAGELISEGVLAVEMGATVRDLAECIHPHPTLSETLMESAEYFYGHATHLFSSRKPQ